MAITGDADVLALFEQEAAERLTNLGDLLLQLDSGGDADVVAALFREAHTLKGAAVVVGLDAIGAEAHALEEVLADVRAGVSAVTPELLDGLFAALDRLGELTGVQGVSRADGPRGISARAALPDLDATLTEGPVSRTTARVAVERLDDLVRLAGEATSAHLRLAEEVRQRLDIDPFSVSEMRALMRVLADLQEGTLRARMLPVSAMATSLRRAARDASRKTGKIVRCEIRGEDTELDRRVHERLADALLHLVRNAVDHGIEGPEVRRAVGKREEGTIVVHAMQLGSRVIVTVTDDGRGIDTVEVRRRAADLGVDTAALSDDDVHQLLFQAGFSTAAAITDISGRGVGLDAVRDVIASLRGRIDVTSTLGGGTRFRISVPITLTLLPGLLVESGAQRFALPMANVVTVLPAGTPEIRVDGRPAVLVGDHSVPLVSMATVLGAAAGADGPIVVLSGLDRTLAVRVDRLAEQREVLVKAMPSLLPPNDLVVGASAEPDGTVLLVLDAEALVEGAVRVPSAVDPAGTAPRTTSTTAPARRRGTILVVDDALTVRELQRTILERAGYDVRVAVDGRDALALLGRGPVDLVLTDLEMPEMDGLELVAALREHPVHHTVPIVILTSRSSDADRQAGLEAGADAYIVKSSFDEAALRNVVASLLESRAA